MDQEGPQLDALVRRLAECPPAFQEAPLRGGSGIIDVPAIVCDHFRQLEAGNLSDEVAEATDAIGRFEVNHQQLIAAVIWLLHDPWFLERPGLSVRMRALLVSETLGSLAEIVRTEIILNDPDRREEIVRICLNAMGLRPKGETVFQATDRLNTLDSVERAEVMQKTRAAEARAQRIRREMVRRAAQEAAARYSPE